MWTQLIKQIYGVAMVTKMGPSYAHLFIGYIELGHTHFLISTTASNPNSAVATLTIVPVLLLLPEIKNLIDLDLLTICFIRLLNIPGKFPIPFFSAFLDIKVSIEGISLWITANPQILIKLVICCIYLHINHVSRITIVILSFLY